MSSTKPIRRISFLGFAEEVRHTHANMPDRRFCFVLGAGASRASLIPTAGELGIDWLKKLHVEGGSLPAEFSKWLHQGHHGIKELPAGLSSTDMAAIAAAYPAIYLKKWGHDPAQGYAEIERHIEAAKPSYGYYALAEILASDDSASPSRHNVVITPNFDNLPAEALGALGKKIPMVIGHSALASFARPTLKRPLIIKFHNDFMLGPKSQPDDVDSMEAGYAKALADMFRLYTPIVVGYGGNDGSLMGLLENLPEKSIPGGILWCYRKGDEPSEKIHNVVEKQAGTLIEIPGFDELMVLLEQSFGKIFDPEKLGERAELRKNELKKAKKHLNEKMERNLFISRSTSEKFERVSVSDDESSAVLDVLNAPAVDSNVKEGKTENPLLWWHWQKRINATADLDEQERLFKEGLAATQNAPQLLGNYAFFLSDKRKDYIQAENYYIKSIEAAPSSADIIGSYAAFLMRVLHDYDKAQYYYLKSIEMDSNNSVSFRCYAIFLEDKRNDYDQAQEYYLKAIAIDPNNSVNFRSYAYFLASKRNDYGQAQKYYLKAIAIDPNNSVNFRGYAHFLENNLSDYGKAQEYYLKAIAIDPNDSGNFGGYAHFVVDKLNDYEQAKLYYLKAIEINCDDVFVLCNYAQFLIGQRKFAEATPLACRAWSLLPSHDEMSAGEVAFSLWLLAAVSGGNEQPALGRLKTILQAGYRRYPWSFDAMLEACLPKLSDDQKKLANKLAAAILDASQLEALSAEPLWETVCEIPLNTPWPEVTPV